MSTQIIYVEGVPGRANKLVRFETSPASDACPSNDKLRAATKDVLEWWDTDNAITEQVTVAEFTGRFGIKPEMGIVFLMIDGERFDYQEPFQAMSSELFINVHQGGSSS